MKPENPQGAWHEVLAERFGEQLTLLETPFDIPQYRVAPEALRDVARFLKEDQEFDMLLDVGGVDYLPRTPRFEVVYHFLRLKDRKRLRLRCSPEDERPQLPTLSDLWPTAEPAEREVYDLFGVEFLGHPNLTRIMMPYDWKGHPLRKDYPLKGEREAVLSEFAAERNRFHAPKLSGEGRE